MKRTLVGVLILVLLLSAAVFFKWKALQEMAHVPTPAATRTAAVGDAQPLDIRVATTAATVEKTDTSEVSYSYPVFTGLPAGVAEKINADIKDLIVKAAEANRGKYGEYCGDNQPAVSEGWHCSYAFDDDYKSFTALSDRLLSVRLETYSYTGGAHGGTHVAFVNYDLRTGERVKWQSVFKKDADYLGALAKYANADIRKQLLTGEDSMTQASWIDEGSAPTTENYGDDSVGFDQDHLLVVFQQYQVAAYAQGVVEVHIPYGELKEVIEEKGVLGG